MLFILIVLIQSKNYHLNDIIQLREYLFPQNQLNQIDLILM